MDFFKRFMKDERFNGMPIVLETPDESLWAEEIRLLRSLSEVVVANEWVKSLLFG